MVILLFAGADAAMRAAVRREFASGSFRPPHDSDRLVVEFIEYLNERPADSPAVFMIGDSVIQGARLPTGQAVPARLAARLPGARVANLGLTAAKTPDFFFVTHRLRAVRRDIAVYNINVKNFGAFDRERPLRFHDLYIDDAFSRTAAGADLDALDVRGESTADVADRLRATLREGVLDRWFLFRNRDAVSAALFGAHPRKTIEGYYRVAMRTGARGAMDRLERRVTKKDWRDTRWEPWAVDALRRYYDIDPALDRNVVFRFVGHTARLARARGLVPIVFMTPMNRELCDRFGLVDWERYARDVAAIRASVEAAGGVFWDFTDAASTHEFVDNDHLTAEGADRLAARLAEHVAPLIENEALP